MVVVGEGVALDPVAAMRQVDTRSFKALVAEPREQSRDAKEQQQKDFQDMDGKVIVEYVVKGFSCVLSYCIHGP